MPTLLENVSRTSVLGERTELSRAREVGKVLTESKKAFKKGKTPPKALADLSEAIRKRQITYLDLGGMRTVFEALLPNGAKMLAEMETQVGWIELVNRFGLTESNGTSVAAFADLNYHLLSAQAMDAYQAPTFLADLLTTNLPSNLKIERKGKIANIGDEAIEVGEFERYPTIQRSTDYVDIGEAKKRGFVHSVSREALFFNRTQQSIDEARAYGESLAINKEKRVLDIVFGIVNNWSPKDNGKSVSTYQTGGVSDRFDNTITSNPLSSYRALQAVKKKASKMVDRNTGEPVVIGDGEVLVPKALEIANEVWWNAPEVRETTGDIQAVSRNFNPTISEKQHSNEYVSRRSGSDTTWLYGNFKKAFGYKEHWPFTTIQIPQTSAELAMTDTVSSTVVSEYGDPFVDNPEYVFKSVA